MIQIQCMFLQTGDLGVNSTGLIQALQSFVTNHLAKAWQVDAIMGVYQTAATWPLIFLDDSDHAQALGYHDDAPGPRGLVFVQTALAAGQSVSEVASHELAEMLIDPWLNRAVLSPRRNWVALEVCDPVQGDTFTISNLQMANFATPAWYRWYGSAPYDYLKVCKRPWEIRPAGYVSVYRDGEWAELFGDEQSPRPGLALRRPDRRRRRSSVTASGLASRSGL